MKRILGIDLGTVNSCVAIPSDDTEGKVIIVRDDKGREKIPSVVMRNNKGEYVVGHLAKQRIGTSANPVSFIKRYMGKEHKIDVGGEKMSPEQVSAKILKYLAKLAQEQTGEEFKQAVITIPAYFGLPGQQATVEAAKLGDLEVLATLPDPVAAALAYGLEDEEDDITIFCYDLGAATFDATVMKKSPKIGIQVIAFDGDPYLGGYNIDVELARWVLSRLQKDYSLEFDWESAEDKLRFQKLMVLAEKTKTTLSTELECNIFQDEIFEDHDGEPVDVDLTITRDEFEEAIAPLIAETMSISQRALEKAGIQPQDIDKVILVGGSCRIPVIQMELSKIFGTKPQLIDPDTIVARGAAIRAGIIADEIIEGIEFFLDIPKTCPFETFDISAKVTLDEHGGLPVILERKDGGYGDETETDENGRFEFLDIELIEDELNKFKLTVGTLEDPKVCFNFDVLQDVEKTCSSVGNVNFVTQDISLLSSTGFLPIFQEGENIPGNRKLTLKSVQDNELFLRFDVYNGNQHIGEVMIDDIPPSLPAGSELLLDIAITDDLKLDGTATLVKTGQLIPFSFRIPRPRQMNAKEIEASFEELKEEYEETLKTISDDLAKMEFKGKGEKLKTKITAEILNKPIDDAKIQRLISEFTGLIQEMSMIDVMEPPFVIFEKKLEEARQLIEQAVVINPDRIKAEDFPGIISSIETFGRDVFESREKIRWKVANEQIDKVLGEINYILNKDKIDNITPEMLASYFYQTLENDLGDVKDFLNKIIHEPRGENYIRFIPELDNLIISLNQVSFSDPKTTIRECKKLINCTKSIADRLTTVGTLVGENGQHYHSVYGPFNFRKNRSNTKFKKTSEYHGTISDLVHFSITSPPIVACNQTFLMDIWAHRDEQRETVVKRAREEAAGDAFTIRTQQGPHKIARGSIVTVKAKIDGFVIKPAEATLYWEGDIGKTTFSVFVPADTLMGKHTGECEIFLNGFSITTLFFSVTIGEKTAPPVNLESIEKRIKKAFASYANEDYAEVLRSVQGLKIGNPDMDIFYDKKSIPPGVHWKEYLQKEILSSDKLYLFWSRAASESEWVNWEWRYGYQEKGVDFISPFPLISPEDVPPPHELEELHFNDWIITLLDVRNTKEN